MIKKLIQLKCDNPEEVRHVEEFYQTLDKIDEIGIDTPKEFIDILLLYSLPENFESFRNKR